MDSLNLVFLVNVGIDTERQFDVGMPCERLSGLGRNLCLAEVRDERVPETVKIGELPFFVPIKQEVLAAPFLFFFFGFGFGDL